MQIKPAAIDMESLQRYQLASLWQCGVVQQTAAGQHSLPILPTAHPGSISQSHGAPVECKLLYEQLLRPQSKQAR